MKELVMKKLAMKGLAMKGLAMKGLVMETRWWGIGSFWGKEQMGLHSRSLDFRHTYH